MADFQSNKQNEILLHLQNEVLNSVLLLLLFRGCKVLRERIWCGR
uniref:Uncharacterized protein n=1 Tax=Anguilla anguilla TaxID=7936 RepID=A0A0E9V2E4_ANGAN